MNTRQDEPEKDRAAIARESRFTKISWVVTIALVILMVAALVWQPTNAQSSPSQAVSLPGAGATPTADPSQAALPDFSPSQMLDAVIRHAVTHTNAPDWSHLQQQDYTVAKGDSVFAISVQFKLKPETILWANYDTLNDDPDQISPGLVLHIPPVDGVYYQWQDGDTLQGVADRFKAAPDAIVAFPANRIDIANPVISAGTYIMIPGGWREVRQWIVPTIPRGPAGVLKSVLGPGACDTTDGGMGGSGAFIWPAASHIVSGNDFWSGHLGLDIGAGEGMRVVASDSGVVVFAGLSYGGYGYMVMLDHGNGYQTLYGHLSVVSVGCGQSVARGVQIGLAGSTGNSTGPHLHFEVRFMGGFINPWHVLPAP